MKSGLGYTFLDGDIVQTQHVHAACEVFPSHGILENLIFLSSDYLDPIVQPRNCEIPPIATSCSTTGKGSSYWPFLAGEKGFDHLFLELVGDSWTRSEWTSGVKWSR